MTDNRAREALLRAAVEEVSERLSRQELVALIQNEVLALLEAGEPPAKLASACEHMCARLGIFTAELARLTN